MKNVTEGSLLGLQKLIKLGASSHSINKSTEPSFRSTSSVLELLPQPVDTIPLAQTGYVLLGLSRLFAHKCSRFLDLLNKKWKAMIGWMPVKQADPVLRMLDETTNEVTLIEKMTDSLQIEDIHDTTIVDTPMRTSVFTAIEPSPTQKLNFPPGPSQCTFPEPENSDLVLPKLGLELSSQPAEDKSSLPARGDQSDPSIAFEPSDCLDKLSLSLLEDTEDVSSLNLSRLSHFHLSSIDPNAMEEAPLSHGVADINPDTKGDAEPAPNERSVIDDIFTGLNDMEEELDELDSRIIFEESQRGLAVVNPNTGSLDKDLALEQPTPQPLARPIQVPKSLLNIAEDSSYSSEPDVSFAADLAPHVVELSEEESDEDNYDAYKRRNQLKSRYDITIRLNPERRSNLQQLATILANTPASRKVQKRAARPAGEYQRLKIPAWCELLSGTDLLSRFGKKPAESRTRQRHLFEPINPSSDESEGKELAEDAQPVDILPRKSSHDLLSLPEDLSIDDVMRDNREDHHSEISDLSLLRPPPAVGREIADGEAQHNSYETMEALPYNESELIFMSDDDSQETLHVHTKFEKCLFNWLQKNEGRDTLQNTVKNMPRDKEFEYFEMGDFIHELVSLETRRIHIQQDTKEASEPIYLTVCE